MEDLTQQIYKALNLTEPHLREFTSFLEHYYIEPLNAIGIEITKYSHIEHELGNCHALEGPVKDSSFKWLKALDKILTEAWDELDDKPYLKIDSHTLTIIIPYGA